MKSFPIIFFLAVNMLCPAQDSTYRLSENLDISLMFTAGVAAAGSQYASGIFKMPVDRSIQYNRMEVNVFDRSATYRYSKAADTWSNVPVYVAFSLPLLHLASKNSRSDFVKITVMAAEVYALTASTTALIKNTFPRKRPLMYQPDISDAEKWKRDNFRSFFSGHTANTAAMSFFFAQTYSDYHPRSRWRWAVWTICAALPAATAVLRYESGKHFWTDVITGYAFGALVGTGVPLLHKIRNKKKAASIGLKNQ